MKQEDNKTNNLISFEGKIMGTVAAWGAAAGDVAVKILCKTQDINEIKQEQ